MVGEIRDRETPEPPRGSLTGHLVLSTLHRAARRVVWRLLEMGVEPYLLASSVLGIVAQRLVRKNLPRRAVPRINTPPALRAMFREGDADVIYRGAGCDDCRGTGFRGRVALFELMRMSDDLRRADSRRRARSAAARAGAARRHAHAPRRVHAAGGRGETTLEEVLRVTQERK